MTNGAARHEPFDDIRLRWVAQRRFEACPIESPAGPIYPCIGVYTVNGCPKGIYGRFSYTPVIDFAAVDVAVLIADD